MQAVLRDECQLDPALPLVAGVSGGPDSLALLVLLVRLGWRVHAAHFDHQLRLESGADAEWVRDFAGRLGVPFWAGKGDVGFLARKDHLSIEEAARQARYSFLFDYARKVSAQAVVVGHTASDQVETVLMHLLRGAGLAGLKGMAACSLQDGWDSQIPLARPLLGVWREDIEAFCRENGLEPRQDVSNADTAYFRNRLRHELIPFLETYNPRLRPALLRTAAVLAGDWAVLEDVLEQAWKQSWRAEGQGYCAFDLASLRGLAPGLLRGLLRRGCAGLRPGLRDIDFEDIERAVSFVHRPTRTGQMDWVSGLRLFLEEDWLYLEEPGSAPLSPRWPQLGGAESLLLEVPGRVELPGGLALLAEWEEAAPLDWSGRDASEAWLDGRSLALPLVVRAAHMGECFSPLGLGGRSQKLSDYWINTRVPRRARACYPLVCSQERIVWIPGLRSAEEFHLTPACQRIVHLRLVNQPGAG